MRLPTEKGGGFSGTGKGPIPLREKGGEDDTNGDHDLVPERRVAKIIRPLFRKAPDTLNYQDR